jgi:hypothetical protein
VVVAASEKNTPRHQVFLVFTDGSNFEFWGDSFTCCGGVDRTRDIERYIASGGGEVVAVYSNPVNMPSQPPSTGPSPVEYCVNARPSLESLMTKDLAAWNVAKQAILRARSRAMGRRI